MRGEKKGETLNPPLIDHFMAPCSSLFLGFSNSLGPQIPFNSKPQSRLSNIRKSSSSSTLAPKASWQEVSSFISFSTLSFSFFLEISIILIQSRFFVFGSSFAAGGCSCFLCCAFHGCESHRQQLSWSFSSEKTAGDEEDCCFQLLQVQCFVSKG